MKCEPYLTATPNQTLAWVTEAEAVSPARPRDRSLMGEYATGRAWTVVIVAVTLMIATAAIVLGILLAGG
jgi:hypothetical protein